LNLRADAVKDITGSGDLLRSLMDNIPGIVYRGMPASVARRVREVLDKI
jgi:hypothetical protein